MRPHQCLIPLSRHRLLLSQMFQEFAHFPPYARGRRHRESRRTGPQFQALHSPHHREGFRVRESMQYYRFEIFIHAGSIAGLARRRKPIGLPNLPAFSYLYREEIQ